MAIVADAAVAGIREYLASGEGGFMMMPDHLIIPGVSLDDY